MQKNFDNIELKNSDYNLTKYSINEIKIDFKNKNCINKKN